MQSLYTLMHLGPPIFHLFIPSGKLVSLKDAIYLSTVAISSLFKENHHGKLQVKRRNGSHKRLIRRWGNNVYNSSSILIAIHKL